MGEIVFDWAFLFFFITSDCGISTLLLSYVVKSKMEISQNSVAFSEYMNFTAPDTLDFVTIASNFSGRTLDLKLISLPIAENYPQEFEASLVDKFHSFK